MRRIFITLATAATLVTSSCTLALGGAGAGTGALVAHTADGDKSDAALVGLLAGAIIGFLIDKHIWDNLCLPITPGSCDDDD